MASGRRSRRSSSTMCKDAGPRAAHPRALLMGQLSSEQIGWSVADCSMPSTTDVPDVIEVGFQEEMPAVKEFDARIRGVPTKRRGAGRTKDFIVLPPDGQHGDAGRSQPDMDLRVQRAIAGVVGEQGKLRSIDAGPSHLRDVVLPRIGGDGRDVGNPVRVLPLDGFAFKRWSKGFCGGGRAIVAVVPYRLPDLRTESLVVGIPVMRDP